MESFLSNYTYKVDRKGRLSVPAPFRQILCRNESRRFGAFASPSQIAIRCCGPEILDRICADRDPMAIFSEAEPDEAYGLAAEMQELSLDEEGRVILPKHLMDYAQIVDQATFAGRINFFEIWEPARFQEQLAQQREKRRIRGAAAGGGML